MEGIVPRTSTYGLHWLHAWHLRLPCTSTGMLGKFCLASEREATSTILVSSETIQFYTVMILVDGTSNK